jgi:hypothetical protein
MEFLIRASESGWDLTPTSGPFDGRVVGRADGISLKGVRFANKTVLGTIKAVWGLTVLIDDVYDSMYTLRGLKIGGVFMPAGNKIHVDFDGFFNGANVRCQGAKFVTLIGDCVYAKGVI